MVAGNSWVCLFGVLAVAFRLIFSCLSVNPKHVRLSSLPGGHGQNRAQQGSGALLAAFPVGDPKL